MTHFPSAPRHLVSTPSDLSCPFDMMNHSLIDQEKEESLVTQSFDWRKKLDLTGLKKMY